MPPIDRHLPGTCCWLELGTTDVDAGSRFYSGLFGWEIHKSPMGPDAFYYIFRLGGRDVAAGYKLADEQRREGLPAHWLTYFSTPDADATASRAVSLGAALLKEPFDVLEVGRMAVVRDPQGAVFALWQPHSHHGIGRRDEPGTLCWNELMTTDADAAAQFYTALFGLGHGIMPMPDVSYHLLKAGDRPMSGIMTFPPALHGVPPSWTVYLAASDCDTTAAMAERLGGRTLVRPSDVPTVGRFAVLGDPQGAAFGVLARGA
jgi:predicted enzyme related to lactoylglutathione lyase